MRERCEAAWIASSGRVALVEAFGVSSAEHTIAKAAFVDGWKSAYRDARATLLAELS